MKTIIILITILISFSSFAESTSCFTSSIFNEDYETRICLNNLGEKQEITATGFFSGFAELEGFDDSNIVLKEYKRVRTLKGDPQIIYAPSILNDGRELYITLTCADDYGIHFVAALQDNEMSSRPILIVGQSFQGCEELWRRFP